MPVPSSIADLSTTAASNSPAGTDAISNTLDDYLRAIQAIIRSESLNKSWEAPGHTPTYLSATQFTVQTDLTGTYRVGRRIKATLAGPTTAYSTITASDFAANVTTVTVANDSTALSSPISAIEVGPNILALASEQSPLATRAWIQALLATTGAAGIVQLAGSTAVNAASPSSTLVPSVADLRAGNIVSNGGSATTSGTSVDVTGIPSWAQRITVALNDVSTNGTDFLQVQLGKSAGIETSGYSSSASAGTSAGASSAGFLVAINGGAAAATFTGIATFMKATGNTWICSSITSANGATVGTISAGSKTLGGTLDRIRFTTRNGADLFDAGSITVFWE